MTSTPRCRSAASSERPVLPRPPTTATREGVAPTGVTIVAGEPRRPSTAGSSLRAIPVEESKEVSRTPVAKRPGIGRGSGKSETIVQTFGVLGTPRARFAKLAPRPNACACARSAGCRSRDDRVHAARNSTAEGGAGSRLGAVPAQPGEGAPAGQGRSTCGSNWPCAWAPSQQAASTLTAGRCA